MKMFASVYIGSYEVILKVFEGARDKGMKEVDCLKASTEIAQDIYTSGKVSFETTERLCNVLKDMKKTIAMYQVRDYQVYIGSTIDLADNDLFVLEQIKLRTGMVPVVLSNSEHRFLGYKAVASGTDFDRMVEESAAIVDVGGGSLQITLFVKGKIKTTQHIMLGTVTLAENIKRLSHAPNYREQILQMMYKELEVFGTMYLQDTKVKYLILLGDQVASMVEHLGVSDSRKCMKSEDYLEFLQNSSRDSVERIASQIDILDDNQELLEPFLLMHRVIAEKIPAKYIYVPGVAINEGIAYNYYDQHRILVSPHNFEDDILSAAWSIAKRYGSYQPHLKALEKISLMIFDTTKKYHGMGARQRLLMRVASILHDCGKYISISEAANCSYTIIMSSEILGLTHKEREMVAHIVAFNRKDLESYQEMADRFTQEEYMTIVKLLAILKVANALDRSHRQKFKDIKMSVKGNKLDIVVEASDSIALEKGLFEEKADFFESIFAIRPVLRERRVFL